VSGSFIGAASLETPPPSSELAPPLLPLLEVEVPLDVDPLLPLLPLLAAAPDEDPPLDVEPVAPLLLVPSSPAALPTSLPNPEEGGLALQPSAIAPTSAQSPTVVAIFIVPSIHDVVGAADGDRRLQPA
jgi:hypothetical protein